MGIAIYYKQNGCSTERQGDENGGALGTWMGSGNARNSKDFQSIKFNIILTIYHLSNYNSEVQSHPKFHCFLILADLAILHSIITPILAINMLKVSTSVFVLTNCAD